MPSHVVLIRFHYPENDPKFSWRFAYFQSMVLPRLLNQTRQDFDIAIRCYDWHKELFEKLHPKIKTFSIEGESEKYTHKGKKYFYDFVPWRKVQGLEMYDIQTGIDSDDLVREDFIERIYQEVEKHGDKSSLHISFQPYLFDTKTLVTYTMGIKYSPTSGSAFLSLYQPNKENYVFIHNFSHLMLWRSASKSITIPEGYCWASCHNHNESTAVNIESVPVKDLLSAVKRPTKQLIVPKIIHQIWVGDQPMPIEKMKSWKKRNPEFKHWIWTEKAIEMLPLKNLTLYNFYKSKKLYYGMSDVARVEILEKYGGMYVDCDTVCKKPLDEEWFTKEFVCAYSPHTNTRIANGMLICPPNSEIITKYREVIGLTKTFIPVWQTVGSGILTPIVKASTSKNILILPAYNFYPTTKDGRAIENSHLAYCTHSYDSSVKSVTVPAVWSKLSNFGDTLTPHIVKFFTGKEAVRVSENSKGKLVGVGSIMAFLRDNDIVFGTGIMDYDRRYKADNINVIAFRGPKTRALIDSNTELPEVYGDAGLLLPLMYNPDITPTYDVGYVPHYVDKDIVMSQHDFEKENALLIDLRPENIEENWQQVIDQIKKCKKIVSSSLHGVIAGEAYGIPTVWESYSDKIRGGDFKYQDYFLGTGRKEQKKGVVLDPIPDLLSIQNELINGLRKYYG